MSHRLYQTEPSPLVYVSHRTFVPWFFMRVLSYSELKRKITHLYSQHYALGFIPTAAVTKRNTNVSKELNALALRMQRTGQMTQEKEKGRAISSSKLRQTETETYVYTYAYLYISTTSHPHIKYHSI